MTNYVKSLCGFLSKRIWKARKCLWFDAESLKKLMLNYPSLKMKKKTIFFLNVWAKQRINSLSQLNFSSCFKYSERLCSEYDLPITSVWQVCIFETCTDKIAQTRRF